MGWKDAIEGLLVELEKIDLKNGNVLEPIDLKAVETKLRILTHETDRSLVGKEELISIFPGVFLCLSSSDANLRQVVSRFLPNLKDSIEATSCNYNDWKKLINSEFVKLCADKLILIVEEFSDDWIEPWLLLVNILFTDVEGGSFTDISLCNHLLSVVEKAFKTAKIKTEKFETAFQTWERFCTILAESLSYKKFLTTAKRLHLLVLPFISIKQSSADPYKHRAWFHVVEKIGLHSSITVDEIVYPFLHFLIETRRLFINYEEDVGNYIRVISQCYEVVSKYSSEMLKCLGLAIAHDSKHEDIIASWTSLCGHIATSGLDYEYFKKLLQFLKLTTDNEKRNDLSIDLCLIAYQYKLFDFKSLYFDDIRSTCEEVFPLVITSPSFREKVFQNILIEMLDMTENLEQDTDVDVEVYMAPILSMWELMINVYFGFVDASLDSRFTPTPVDVAIIRDLLILPLTQPLFEVPHEENSSAKLLSSFFRCLVVKSKEDIFSSEFLQKFDSRIQSSHIGLDNSVWLASLISKLDCDINVMPLLSIICKSIASCGQPKIVMEFLNILDKASEKTVLKINFKAPLNFLRKFSSSYEPPYDQQIRQLAHNLLRRISESVESKHVSNSCKTEEKKHTFRTPTFKSNFLSRLSKAEDKKNSKNILAATIFPQNILEKPETNKENKQNIAITDVKTDDNNISPDYRFAKSSAFILDSSESSESLPVDNFEPKVAHLKVSTDFHKTVSPGKSLTSKEVQPTEYSPKNSPLNDKAPSSGGKSPKAPTPNKHKYNYLNNSLDNENFVFIPPKIKDSPLTKHQKEVLTKRREGIPALYQDLSQDTQNTSELSSTDHSSQESAAFPFTTEGHNQVLESQDNHKNEENITCIIEENAIFNQNDLKSGSSVDITERQEEDIMKTRGSLSPKRLNFEGICGKRETLSSNSENEKGNSELPSSPSLRKCGRKSTSKYRKAEEVTSNTELVPSPLKRKLDCDSNKHSSPSKKMTALTSNSNNETTSLATDKNISLPKRRGRKSKAASEASSVKSSSVDCSDSTVKTSKNISTSPVLTRRKRKSMVLDSDSIKVDHEINETNMKKQNISITNKSVPETTQLSVLSKNSDQSDATELQLCTNISENPALPVEIPSNMSNCGNEDSPQEYSNIKTPVIVDAKQNNEKPFSPSKCSEKENLNISDVSSPISQTSNEVAGKPIDVSSNVEPSLKTPPSVETPNRRKRNKKTIKFNEYSPKMLRRGKVGSKMISPQSDKSKAIVKRKSLNLDSLTCKVVVEEKSNPKSPVKIKNTDKTVLTELSNSLDTKNEAVSIKNDIGELKDDKSELDQLVEKPLADKPEESSDIDCKEVQVVKLIPNQKSTPHLIKPNQDSIKDNKPSTNSKTSPTRARRILEMVNSTGLQNAFNETEVTTPLTEAESLKEDPKDTQSSSKDKKQTVKYYSVRASLIMENLKKKDLNNKLEKNLNDSSKINESDNSSLQNIVNEKQKLMKSPSFDKKTKPDPVKSLNQSSDAVSPAPKVKRSGLDKWLIKKEKFVTPEVSAAQTNSNGSFENPVETQVIHHTNNVQNNISNNVKNSHSIIVNKDNTNSSLGKSTISDHSENALEGSDPNNKESKASEESAQSPTRWPKRWRKDKKPTDFIYMSPIKKSRSPDNRTPTRKPKPKQMDLSPSKPYSFVNWPKGDCETWVACEPTPPEASPVSAILKRKSAYPSPSKNHISPNATPQKHVSFLDPPVSKGLLYCLDQQSGEVQHALNDLGTSVRRKKLVMTVSNDKEDGDIISKDTSTKCNETNPIVLLSINEEAITKMSTISSANDSNLTTLRTSIIVNKQVNIVEDVVEIAIEDNIKCSSLETEETVNSDIVTESESIEVCSENNVGVVKADEPMDVDDKIDNEEVLVVETMNQQPSNDENEISESQHSNESQSQVQEVDIVEKIVGKAIEGSAACIVEPIETCTSLDVSSDESILTVEQDYISISDDLLLASEKGLDETCGRKNHSETEIDMANSPNALVSEEKSVLKINSFNTEESLHDSDNLESKDMDNPELWNTDTNVSLQQSYEKSDDLYNENKLDDINNENELSSSVENRINQDLTDIQITETENGIIEEDEVECLNSRLRLNEETSQASSSTLQETSDSLSSTSTQISIKDKCEDISAFFQSIDSKQISKSSVQDIISVISTLSSFAQKLLNQP